MRSIVNKVILLAPYTIKATSATEVKVSDSSMGAHNTEQSNDNSSSSTY